MTINPGERLPDATFKTMTADGPANITAAEIFDGKKVVLFAVPGAFTPTCSMNHLPGYLEHFETIRSKGVDTIAVVAVNDVWVMGEWAKSSRGEGKILYLSDGNGEFTRAVGLEADMSAAGFGSRSRRYSMIVDNRMVKALNVEQSRGVDVSGAAHIIEQL